METFTRLPTGEIIAAGRTVPADLGNRHTREVLALVAAGEAEIVDVPPELAPPSRAERAASRLASDPALRGLVAALAARLGLSADELVAEARGALERAR